MPPNQPRLQILPSLLSFPSTFPRVHHPPTHPHTNIHTSIAHEAPPRENVTWSSTDDGAYTLVTTLDVCDAAGDSPRESSLRTEDPWAGTRTANSSVSRVSLGGTPKPPVPAAEPASRDGLAPARAPEADPLPEDDGVLCCAIVRRLLLSAPVALPAPPPPPTWELESTEAAELALGAAAPGAPPLASLEDLRLTVVMTTGEGFESPLARLDVLRLRRCLREEEEEDLLFLSGRPLDLGKIFW